MGLFDWFGNLFHSDDGIGSTGSSFDTDHTCSINPATGLPMIDGCGSVDVMGNPFGMDNDSLHHSSTGTDDLMSGSSSWDDSFSWNSSSSSTDWD